jgi:hypothetical protein
MNDASSESLTWTPALPQELATHHALDDAGVRLPADFFRLLDKWDSMSTRVSPLEGFGAQAIR